jgi:hypothetical protein
MGRSSLLARERCLSDPDYARSATMHPLQQPLQEYPEQQTQYTAIRRLLGAAPRRWVAAHILHA